MKYKYKIIVYTYILPYIALAATVIFGEYVEKYRLHCFVLFVIYCCYTGDRLLICPKCKSPLRIGVPTDIFKKDWRSFFVPRKCSECGCVFE